MCNIGLSQLPSISTAPCSRIQLSPDHTTSLQSVVQTPLSPPKHPPQKLLEAYKITLFILSRDCMKMLNGSFRDMNGTDITIAFQGFASTVPKDALPPVPSGLWACWTLPSPNIAQTHSGSFPDFALPGLSLLPHQGPTNSSQKSSTIPFGHGFKSIIEFFWRSYKCFHECLFTPRQIMVLLVFVSSKGPNQYFSSNTEKAKNNKTK